MMVIVLAAVLLAGAAVYWLCMSPHAQMFGAFPYRGKTKRRVVALTFDDGPNEPFTSQIVDYLAAKHIRATFFQVGQCIRRYPEVTRKIAAAGHVIGNHSLSHQFYQYLLHPAFKKQIMANQTIVREVIGKTPLLFRPPWLMRQPWLMRTLRRQGLQPVSGEFCHSLEVLQPSAARIAKAAVAKARPGAIIIFHDGFDARGGNRSQTVEAVKLTVEVLQAQGYTFVTIDELLGVPAYAEKQQAHSVY